MSNLNRDTFQSLKVSRTQQSKGCWVTQRSSSDRLSFTLLLHWFLCHKWLVVRLCCVFVHVPVPHHAAG